MPGKLGGIGLPEKEACLTGLQKLGGIGFPEEEACLTGLQKLGGIGLPEEEACLPVLHAGLPCLLPEVPQASFLLSHGPLPSVDAQQTWAK